MRIGPITRTRWAVYGRPVGAAPGAFIKGSITQEFQSEEDALVHITKCAMLYGELNAVVVRIDKHILEFAPGERQAGKYKDVCSVTLRLGKGRGWWEGDLDETNRA